MNIDPVNFNLEPLETPLLKTGISYSEPKTGAEGNFATALGNAIGNLKDAHNAASKAVNDYSAGKNIDITEVMLTMEKSQIATDLAIQVRNRFIEGFNELIRMQI